MPTGYTAELMEKGQDFKTFVLTCARAFGATIMQRDDPLSELPKIQERSDYHEKRLAEAKAELTRLKSMTNDQQFDFSIQQKSAKVTSAGEYLQREKDENKRLDDMMAEVVAWTPPTGEHAGLKSFMIEQITISRNVGAYAEKRLREATDKPIKKYYAEAIEKCERDIQYHTQEMAKEQERTNGRNDWIQKLYVSLQPEAAARTPSTTE